MKLLQNKAFVGGLAVVAFGVMAYNIGEPIYRRSHPKRPAAAASKAAAPTGVPSAPGSAVTTAAASAPVPVPVRASVPAASPGSSVDRAFYAARFPEWVQSPPLDPFTPPPAPPPETPKGPSAVDVLKLQGTWRQTGGMVAVINRQALMEGETVDGFTVNRIEADRVLVAGPRGIEEIRFAGDPGASAPSRTPPPHQQASLTPP